MIEDTEQHRVKFTPRDTPPCNFHGCAKPFNEGIGLTNTNGAFSKMGKNERMHFECYIEHCIDSFLLEKLEKYK